MRFVACLALAVWTMMVLLVTMSIPSHMEREEVSISRRHEGEPQVQVDERKECAECQAEPPIKYATWTQTNSSMLSHIQFKDEIQYRGVGRQPDRPLQPRETVQPASALPPFSPEPEIGGFMLPGTTVSPMFWIPEGKWKLYIRWLQAVPEGIIRSIVFLTLNTHELLSNINAAGIYLERLTGPMGRPRVVTQVTWPASTARRSFQTEEYDIYEVKKTRRSRSTCVEWWIGTQ